MKVAQNDETILDTHFVRPPHTPNLSNSQLFPSGSSVQKRETPGILSRMFPPFVGITSYRVIGTLSTTHCLVMHRHAYVCIIFIVSSLSSLVRHTETDAAATQYDYGVDDPSLPEQPGKPPLDHQISPIPSLYCLH